MLLQPVLAEARGSPCQEAWRGWSTAELWGRAGVWELVVLVGHTCHFEHGGGFWVAKIPCLDQRNHASGLREAKLRLFLVR